MQCQSIDELRRSETHREKNCISCVSFLYLCWYTCLAPSFHHVFLLSVAIEIIIRASWQAALPCISDPDDVYMLIANSNTRYLFRIQTSIRFYDCPFDLNKRSMRSVWPIPFTLSSMIIAHQPHRQTDIRFSNMKIVYLKVLLIIHRFLRCMLYV